MPKIVLQRKLSKRSGNDKIRSQIEYIVGRGLGGSRGKTWNAKVNYHEPFVSENQWVFRCEVEIDKISGTRGSEAEYKQWQEIQAMIFQSAKAAKFLDSPWEIIEENQNLQANADQEMQAMIAGANAAIIKVMGIKEVTNTGPAKSWADLHIPPELLGPESDKHLAEHEAWKDLYDLGPQIRIILSNIQRAKETNGESRNHITIFGHAGCGKTTTMLGLEKMFGEGSVLRLDATSTTRAGLEKLFFSDLQDIPPLVFMEEAEKADPEALKIWLGALDDRGEIRKINFRVNQLREIKVLFICSVNNKALFDRMMGSDGTEAGALSSRCVSQIYFPRPSLETLRQILKKEIDQNGGKNEWIPPALELARNLGVSDPRIVRHYLCGGDRLLDGTYQNDWMAINQESKSFQKL